MCIGDSNRYFGWGEDRVLDQGILWHNVGSVGFNSYLAFNKERRVGIVLLLNSENGLLKKSLLKER